MDQQIQGQGAGFQDDVKATTDHEFIRQWIAERQGLPALIRRVGQEGEGKVVINFPNDGSDEPIVDISWTDFFDRFEDHNLAFVYRESETDDQTSRFYRLVDRNSL